ncbi:hypothetical protein ABZ070_16820 [Streptomyces sp. NPDC006283]|uniref:hypothetical protein n=1 Tax=Streptomyces sp. NPDC006283 TaxID=3156741 RepID=UPI0033B15E5D
MLAALVVAGCSSGPPQVDSGPDAAAVEETTSSTSEESAEPDVPEAPAVVTVEIKCLDDTYASHYYTSPEEAWPAKCNSCEGEAPMER